jgi:integrase
MPFDARTAKLLQPGQHIILQEYPGLRLEASASRRTWIYRYKTPTPPHRMRQLKLGEWPAMSPAAAAGEWQAARVKRDAGEDPAAAKRTARQVERAAAAAVTSGPYLVRHLCRDYLANHVDQVRKPKGRKDTRRLLELVAAPIADEIAEKLTRRQAFDLLQAMANTPVQAGALRGELGAAWDYGLDSGRLPENTPNWWRQILRGKLRSKGKKIEGKHIGAGKRSLNAPELGALVNWLPNFSKMVTDVLTLYLWTGTRGAEIVAMEKCEISDEETGLWWTIPKAKTKNARHENATDLRVPLIGRAASVVRRRLQLTDRYVFESLAEGHVQQKAVQTAVHYHQPYSKTRPKSLRPRLTVTRWSPHDLRRTTRTLLASMGTPAELAEAVLGHVTPGVRGVYDRHTYDAERLHWLTLLSARLEQLALQHQA